MKAEFLAGVSVAALTVATPAFAAPVYQASPVVQIYNWTGFYVGANVGASWGHAPGNFNDPGLAAGFGFGPGGDLPSSFPVTLKPNGFVGGGQFGHNWQVGNQWILGLEADLQGTSEQDRSVFGNTYVCDFEGATCNLAQSRDAKIHWFGTVRGRVGWLVTPTAWLYGTGGLAFGKVSSFGTVVDDINNTGASFRFGDSQVKTGYAVGAGLEGAILDSPNWTWKVEYLYVDLGSLSGSGREPISGSFYSWDTRFTDHVLRFGVNYRLRQP
jgi:outer membrane immunogenic protein